MLINYKKILIEKIKVSIPPVVKQLFTADFNNTILEIDKVLLDIMTIYIEKQNII